MPTYFDWQPTDWYEDMDGHLFSLAFEAWGRVRAVGLAAALRARHART